MMMRNSIRFFSTKSVVDKLFNVLQPAVRSDRQTRLNHFVKNYLQQGETFNSNLVSTVIHHWATEQPTREALWTCKTNSNECQKLTFNDIYNQSSRLANVLTGKEFNLEPGKTVLVILPYTTQERILLQLACLQSDLIFCPYDPKDLTNIGLTERIRKLSVDCIITNTDNLESVRKCIHNPIRPLLKGLITNCSLSEPLPIGWNHLMQTANDANNKYTKRTDLQSNTPVIRLLSNNNHVIEYSQENFNLRLILTAFWLNINKSSDLIWLKNQNEIISIAPWLFGSSIFHKETDNFKAIFNTLEEHPIDTLCASSTNYQMLENQLEQQENKIHLQQLLSTEPIDSKTKAHWHSLTNLHIQDDYVSFNNKSMIKYYDQ